ncbi:hypothetical protein CDCA_CDCA03G0966 [Cyanidium caldarium]|uniref:Transmembrane protein n=1 Tax=Cyanidium caldarium TaxID=2771 RepID=A0AAV9IS98_CYACA|nr:hypothetical protein CDCA_CDCA03G0966 [Cyanidium caldarium]
MSEGRAEVVDGGDGREENTSEVKKTLRLLAQCAHNGVEVGTADAFHTLRSLSSEHGAITSSARRRVPSMAVSFRLPEGRRRPWNERLQEFGAGVRQAVRLLRASLRAVPLWHEYVWWMRATLVGVLLGYVSCLAIFLVLVLGAAAVWCLAAVLSIAGVALLWIGGGLGVSVLLFGAAVVTAMTISTGCFVAVTASRSLRRILLVYYPVHTGPPCLHKAHRP